MPVKDGRLMSPQEINDTRTHIPDNLGNASLGLPFNPINAEKILRISTV
jgi:hypothetical protein